MKQLGRPVCPYCGKKVNFIITWGLRRRGEYRCPRCQGISNVFLSGAASVSAFLAVAISGILMLCLIFLLKDPTWWSVLAVLAPYVVFYIISLFCVQLRKPVFRRTSRSGDGFRQTGAGHRDEDMENTRVL